MNPIRLLAAVALAATFVVPSIAAAGPGPRTARPVFHDVDRMVTGERVRFAGIELPAAAADGRGETVDLVLERFEVLAPDARIVAASGARERRLAAPRVVLLRGVVAGDETSRVFVGLSPFGVHGYVERSSGLHILSTGAHVPGAAPGALRVMDAATLDEVDPDGLGCGTDDDAGEFFPRGRVVPDGAADRAESDGTVPCRILDIAVDTDWEFTGLRFGGDVDAAAAYALTLLGASSEIYRAGPNARLSVTYLRLWEDDMDPWGASSSGAALAEFRDWWRANEQDVERDLATFLSAKNLGGGIAYVGVVCDTEWGYSVSGNLNGSFPYPLQDHHGGNWDIMVVTHELGHNAGTGHTHSFNPPIDGCGLDDCTDAWGGTIMSYCHLCPGGMTNMVLSFHPLVVDRILDHLESVPCDLTIEGEPTARDDQVDTYPETPVVVDVLLNDINASCSEVTIGDFDAVASNGGTVELVPADATIPRARLRYTPPDTGLVADTFDYALVSGESARVRIIVKPFRAADVTGPTDAGVAVAYYALSAPDQLPDFDALEPYDHDVLDDVDLPSTGGVFATSGLSDDVGAVFEGFVTVPEGGLYTLYVNSDDGSRLFVGDEMVVDNDGLHAMVERSGLVALAPGAHAIRIEFFERGGGAGVIASIEGPSTAKQPIPASAWRHPRPCAEDVDRDGLVGQTDLLMVLAGWGPCPAACDEDVDASGDVGFGDLVAVLFGWGACD